MPHTWQNLETRRDGGVEYLTLNRPALRNAFNDEVVAELTRWAETVRADRDVRAVVLAGAGDHFCAGADIAWMRRMQQASEDENREDARRMARMFESLDTLPFPLIGRVHGAALGGGTGLAATCDIVVASDTAVFGFTEVKLGILPAVISPFAIAKIGISAARELFLTGARFSAARAREIGLVHAVVPVAELDAAVGAQLAEIMNASPTGIARAKALIRGVAWRLAPEVADVTTRAIAEQRVSGEGQEGLGAFLEKRKPQWSRS